MCPWKTGTSVHSFHSLCTHPPLPASKAATTRTWEKTEHITLAPTLETTPSKGSTYIQHTRLEYDFPCFPGAKMLRKTSNFGKLRGHHVQHWKWNEEITEQKVPTYSCGDKNGKRETEDKRIKHVYIPYRNHLVVQPLVTPDAISPFAMLFIKSSIQNVLRLDSVFN